MRFCITGYGSIAAVHRDALLPMEGVEIDSVVGRADRADARICRQLRCAARHA